MLKDGSQTVTANIPMSSFKFTGLGAGSVSGNSLRYEQLFSTGAVNLLGPINGVKTTVASATTPDIWTSVGNLVDYTGTTTATGFAAAPQAGSWRVLICAGAAVFTAGANMLIVGVPSASSYTAAANDRIDVFAITTTQFLLVPRQYSGGLLANGLIDISQASGGQIKFPATQNASANVNTLDDYEEGTWTPTDISGGSLSLTASGHYTKIGRLVTVVAQVVYPATADGNTALLGSLPFASANLTGNTAEGSIYASGLAGGPSAVAVPAGSQSIELRSNLGATFTNATLSTGTLRFAVTYFAAT